MSRTINIDGLEVEITRKHIKRLNMRIRHDGQVCISMPYLATMAEAENFVRAKRSWIERNIARLRERSAAHPEPQSAEEKERLRRELKARIAVHLPAIEQRTGLHCSGWTVRDMHTRWGSCNTKTHHINLSLMLATRTDEELDYVIVHELVHTKVDNHGPEFKAYMDRLMPDWRIFRKNLKY